MSRFKANMSATAGMFQKLLSLKKANTVLSKRLVQLFDLNFEGVLSRPTKDLRDDSLITDENIVISKLQEDWSGVRKPA